MFINRVLCSECKYKRLWDHLPLLLPVSSENQGLTGHVIFLPYGMMHYWEGLLARLHI